MKVLPTEAVLRSAFSEFGKFTFELIERIGTDRNYFRFAAVNAQIALELFLKYYFVKLGRVSEIQKKKRNDMLPLFVDFSQILNHFYSSSFRQWSHGKKSEFVELMETRNSIVHAGIGTEWDKELAKTIVRTLLFIHATAWSDLGETLLFDNYRPHPISSNKVWREGVESFIDDLSGLFNFDAIACLACGARSVVSGEIIALNEGHSDEDLICLNCLTSLNMLYQASRIECYMCGEKSYFIDALNEQDEQLYVAKCSECDTDSWVRQCANCERFYHPNSADEVQRNEKYFCVADCAEIYAEEKKGKRDIH